MTVPVQLSLVQPDFQSIRDQLEATLNNYSAWRDLLPSGTGRALTDWIAAVGANDQYAIEHAYRESFRTARLDSSILAQAILLGVRLGRKSPCSTTVIFSKLTTDTITIPPYTQFTATGGMLFNRTAITLNATLPTTAQLYEGVVRSNDITGTGTPFQLFVSGDDKFTVSDEDVEVRLNDVIIPRTTRGLWLLNGKNGVQDTTTATGQLLLTFGGDVYGSVPQTSDRLSIRYTVTRGTLGQNSGIVGDNVVCNDFRVVTGVASAALTGGGDEKLPVFYRKLGPQLFAARDGATTEEEYNAVAAEYPGVVDARVLGQRNVAPADVRWMNMVQVSLLTGTSWTGPQWDDFDRWFRARSIYPVRLYRRDPIPVPINIDATVYCQGRADLATVKSTIESQLRKLFQARPGIIDSNIYLSDIHAAIKGSDSAVEYADINAPTTDTMIRVDSPTITLSTGSGTLNAGQYSYGVTAVTAQGETLVTNFTSMVVDSGQGIRVTWTPVQMAISYNVYGRSALVLGLLASVPAPALTFLDDGSIVPVTGLPLVNGGGHRYPLLGLMNIQVLYTNRNFYDLGNLR